jgi:hypothetical protein
MTDVQERRAQGAGRVPIETLVEICGNEPGIRPFEAEALNVSARGMHLRTAYLPEAGAPLVCRFEDHGREIVVEGVVAWRKEREKGGDFGVTFTALDSRSVDALRGLIKTSEPDGDDEGGEAIQGSRVRLHIEGLGSPMKARVRSGGSEKIQVGSSLEFLKVGRRLEIEDMEAGRRRVAHIDGVEVVINPRTSVPQLVVALRYEGATEDTPQPTVTDLGLDASPREAKLRLRPEAVTTSAARGEPEPSGDMPATDDEDDDAASAADADDDMDSAVPATTRAARKLGNAAENAGERARDASLAAVRFGGEALKSVGKLLGGASAKIAAMRAAKQEPPKRRTTAPAPEGPVSIEGKRLRPQNKSRESMADGSNAQPAARLTRKRIAMGVSAVVLLGTVGAIALSGPSQDAKQASGKGTGNEVAAAEAPAAGSALAAAPLPMGSVAGGPVSANVPLFGVTPLATTEPAPLGPPPSADTESVEAAEMAAAKAASGQPAADEEFPESIERAPNGAAKKGGDGKATNPEDVAPWGRGKMHMPTIQRLRLDAPGAEIRGVVDPTGFTVLIPDRKLMEQGAAIAKRDARISRIRTTNIPGGAQLRIAFRDGVPGYRVRLRRDYLELLISAPEEKPKTTAKAKSTAAKRL